MRTCILLFCALLPLRATTVVNGGQLLTQPFADQLATWLGEGDLALTNIFSAAPAAGAAKLFHAAADGQGRTFSIIQSNFGILGGYNPVSWDSSGNYHINPTDSGRTAFIFNLSNNILFQQILGTVNSNAGQYQTYNNQTYGPTFGGGHDLGVSSNDLSFGYTSSFSYGNGIAGFNLANNSGVTFTSVFRVEVYTIAAATVNTVPEPSTSALLLAAFGFAALRYRRVR